MPSQRNRTHYNMRGIVERKEKNLLEKRGIALIFNHSHFDLELEERHGTNQDAKSMKDMLERFHFDVTVHDDNNFTSLKKHVKDAAEFNHSDYDCFVMVVLSHGDENDFLYASDTAYSFEILWSPFTACECPTLAGKPKLFFIQACRGGRFMPSATVGQNTTDTRSNNSSYTIPAHADFLFAFASVPGYVALRNTDTGSWFIQALCEEFRNNAGKYDILTLLTFVIQRVALDYEHPYRTEEIQNGTQKQIPCVTTSLTSLLKFNVDSDWFQESSRAKTDNVEEEKRNVKPDNADQTYEMMDEMFCKFFKYITGLVALLFFGLISIICSIPIILKEFFYALKVSFIYFHSIIHKCSIFFAKVILYVFILRTNVLSKFLKIILRLSFVVLIFALIFWVLMNLE